MNAYRIIVGTLAIFFSLLTPSNIRAINKQTDIHQTIEKIRNSKEPMNAADIIQIVVYINNNLWNKAKDPLVQKIDALIHDTSCMNKIIKTMIEESFAIDDSTIYFLVNTYPHVIQPLTQAVVSSFDKVKATLITTLIFYNSKKETINAFTDSASKYITTIDLSIIEAIVSKDSQALLSFFKAAFEKPDTPMPVMSTLFRLAKTYNVTVPAQYSKESIKKRIADFFTKRNVKTGVAMLTMLVVYKHMFGSMPCVLKTITPTIQHAIVNANILANSATFSTYTRNQLYSSMIDAIITQEQELDKQGYYTFLHGQRWQFRIVEQWFTKLWEIRNKRSVNDFLFVHCEKLYQTQDELKKESKLRKHILKHGGQNHREKLLFLNYAFFGNENNWCSSSAYYLLNNYNSFDIKITLKDVFTMLDYKTYYAKYKDELAELEDEHRALTSTGHLLLVGIPKTILTDCIYVSGGGGILAYPTIEGKMTNDITLIMNNLANHPEKILNTDVIQFCLILTGDLLTPDSGIKVYSYNIADPVKLAHFEKKSADLFARVKQDIEQA